MNKYVFPFNSCEIPNENGIAQPYSVLINLENPMKPLFVLEIGNNENK
jgi:hypothetical protein